MTRNKTADVDWSKARDVFTRLTAMAETPLKKLAALLDDVRLQPHQQRVADAAREGPVRKLLMWDLGSGKSLGALAGAEAYGKPYTAVVPASLRANMRKEIEKFTDKSTPADVLSYTGLAKGAPVKNLGTLITDEGHRLRNPRSQQALKTQEAADKAEQLLILSGSPVVNHPSDLAAPVGMLTGRRMTPEEFTGRYVGDKKVEPGFFARLRGVKPATVPAVKNEDELRALLQGHVDYYHPENAPVGTTREDIHTTMGLEQSRLYKAMWNELPWVLRYKLRHDFPLDRNELARTLSFLNGPRQVGLSTLPYLRDKDPAKAFSHSTKLQKAMELLQEKLKDPRAKALVYSNFIDAGLTPYHHALAGAGVPAAVFHGGLSDAERKKLVDDYNADKLRVALLGPSGSEGLSFRGTQLIQILDPHWHGSRTRQAEGRGVRYDSHTGLPEDLRNVHIQRFISRTPPGFMQRLMRWWKPPEPGKATDDYLMQMAARKDDINQKFLDILKDIGTRG